MIERSTLLNMRSNNSANNAYRVCTEERCEVLAEYFIENQTTVREVAKKFSISKSTVHKDLTYKLPRINPRLYYDVKKILDRNKMERHLRGGEATKRKYKLLGDS